MKPMKNKLKALVARTPAEISIQSKPMPVAVFSPMTQPYLPGGGWNGGVGKSVLRGNEGYGWGMNRCGTGYPIGEPAPRMPVAREISSGGVSGIVIVLDVSGSMRAQDGAGENPSALREFINGVTTLNAAAYFNVVCFADSAAKFREDSVPATAENVAAAVGWARERFRRPHSGDPLTVPKDSGGTSRMDLGMLAALHDRPQEVLLISDGCPVVREGNRSLPHGVIMARIRAAVPEYAAAPVIHTIATREAGGGFLRRLAAEFQGEYRSAAGDELSRRAWTEAVEQLNYGSVGGKSAGVKPVSTFR